MENEAVRDLPEGVDASEDRPRLLPAAGVGVAVLLVVAPWLAFRFAPAPVEVAAVILVVLLVVLTTLGYLASTRGQGATFVAIALVLPYLVIGTVAYAAADRATTELESIFDEDDPFDEEFSEEDFFDDEVLPEDLGGTYGSDPRLDALHDDCVDGDADACDELYLESPVGSEYESVAIENGAGE
ncbi:hypothetical protein GCM10009821_06580 [Aeromicrobium halocynthiae]|uniref:MFS transporter n=1 Tax=Aeromicrobium halocynthiae TaxID=560557 RepID=A0ABN2VTD0_9ACTN